MTTDLLLVYPPQADLEQCYSSLPYLMGSLRRDGLSVVPLDLNIESLDYFLAAERLGQQLKRVEARLDALDRQETLTAAEADGYRQALQVLACAGWIDRTGEIRSTLQGPSFYEPQPYAAARAVLDWVYTLCSVPYYPAFLTPGSHDPRRRFGSFDELLGYLDSPSENPYQELIDDRVRIALAEHRPAVVGISVTYQSQYLCALTVARSVKRYGHGEVRVVLGGAFATYNQGHVVSHPELFDLIDGLIVDEGETALAAYLHATPGGDPADLPNLRYRDAQGVVKASRHAVVEDLRQHPPPDFDGLDLGRYLSPEPVLLYLPARGCYHHQCAFCSMPHATRLPYRSKSADQIAADLQHLAAKHEARVFSFACDALTPRSLQQIAEAIGAAGLDIRWDVETRMEPGFTAPVCAALYDAGCRTIRFGLESANQRIQDRMAKGYQVDSFAEILQSCSAAGLPTAVQTMLNFPSETAAEAEQTVQFLLQHQRHIAMVNLADFSPVIGSPVMEEPERFGITVQDDGDYLPSITWEDQQGKPAQAHDQLVGTYGPAIHEAWPRCTEPFAGATGGAHPLLYAARFGAELFHQPPPPPPPFPDAAAVDSSRPEVHNAERLARDMRFTLEEVSNFVYESLGERPKRLFGAAYVEQLETRDAQLERGEGASRLLWRMVPPYGFSVPEQVAQLLVLADGSRTLDDIVAELTARSAVPLSQEVVVEVCRQLHELEVLRFAESSG